MLAALSFPSWTHADGLTITVATNNDLVSLDFPVLVSAHALNVTGNVALTSLAAPELTTLAGLDLANNTALPDCQAYAILAANTGALAIIQGNLTDSCSK